MELSDALRELLGDDIPDDRDALIAAAREAWRRRQTNTDAGGAALAALYDKVQSWREVEKLTGIPKDTARRWSEPPPQR